MASAPTASPRSALIQLASDGGNAAGLVFFLFDLLHLDGEDLRARSVIERKASLAALLANGASQLQYCDHQIGGGREFHKQASAMSLEVPPPRSSRFGSLLVLSRVHWVRPNSSPR